MNTNNMAELKAFIAGLNMVITHGWLSVIIEGDSQVILHMATKLLHGKEVHKVVDNWHLAHNLEQLRELLITHSEVKIDHVKRKANQLANIITNYGVDSEHELTQVMWNEAINEGLRDRCHLVMEWDQK